MKDAPVVVHETVTRPIGLFKRAATGCLLCPMLLVAGALLIWIPPIGIALIGAGLLAPLLTPVLMFGHREGPCPACGYVIDVGRRRDGGATCGACRRRVLVLGKVLRLA